MMDDKARIEAIKQQFSIPHIRRRDGRWVCTGRGISVDGGTASGAWIAWVRQAALMVICRMEVAACAKVTESPAAAFSCSEAAHV